jgi:hypothetical protein
VKLLALAAVALVALGAAVPVVVGRVRRGRAPSSPAVEGASQV